MDDLEISAIVAAYLRFAELEAAGRSPLYEALARAVAGDREILGFLLSLPAAKRQPNLLFAALRHLCGTPPDFAHFRRQLAARREAIRAIMLARATQTNEPARCALLLPLLAALPQPLALLEVGASAGLCLLPEYYGYDYGKVTVLPADSAVDVPIFRCDVSGPRPLPTKMPQIAWRAGLDLNPLDAGDPDEVVWLETLVWPEQEERRANLRKALTVAQDVKPRVVKGDLRSGLAALAAKAPKEATLVIFHTAVLAYLESQDDRDAFAATAMSLADAWISNESPRVFPAMAERLDRQPPRGRFLLSRNGVPLAWTDPHGAAMEWIAGEG